MASEWLSHALCCGLPNHARLGPAIRPRPLSRTKEPTAGSVSVACGCVTKANSEDATTLNGGRSLFRTLFSALPRVCGSSWRQLQPQPQPQRGAAGRGGGVRNLCAAACLVPFELAVDTCSSVGNNALHVGKDFVHLPLTKSYLGRVVKALDLKSNVLCTRRFKSCR